MMIVMGSMMFLMPKMMANMSPEELAAMKEAQKNSGGIGGLLSQALGVPPGGSGSSSSNSGSGSSSSSGGLFGNFQKQLEEAKKRAELQIQQAQAQSQGKGGRSK